MNKIRTISFNKSLVTTGVLIGILQKQAIKQYMCFAKTAELIAPLRKGFSYISRPVVLPLNRPWVVIVRSQSVT